MKAQIESFNKKREAQTLRREENTKRTYARSANDNYEMWTYELKKGCWDQQPLDLLGYPDSNQEWQDQNL